MMQFLDATDDVEDDDFLSWETQVHAIPKPTVNRYKSIDMFTEGGKDINYDSMYFIYVCFKDEKRHTDKVIRRHNVQVSAAISPIHTARPSSTPGQENSPEGDGKEARPGEE